MKKDEALEILKDVKSFKFFYRKVDLPGIRIAIVLYALSIASFTIVIVVCVLNKLTDNQQM